MQEYKDFWAQNAGWLRKYLAQRCYQPADADDVLQTIAVKAMRAYAQYEYRNDCQGSCWLLSIARYALLDYYQRQGALPTYIADLNVLEQAVVPDPSDVTLDSLIIRDYVVELPEPWHTAMILYLYFDASIKEISRAIGRSYWTTAKRIERMRRALATELAGGDDGDET